MVCGNPELMLMSSFQRRYGTCVTMFNAIAFGNCNKVLTLELVGLKWLVYNDLTTEATLRVLDLETTGWGVLDVI